MLISKYIRDMPLMGRPSGPDAQIMACMSLADIQLISAKVGEAAKPSHIAGSCNRCGPRPPFLVDVDMDIFELSVEPDEDVRPDDSRP